MTNTPPEKYLRVIAKGVLLHMRRGDIEVYRVFSARRYGSLDSAWREARNVRDQEHLRLFGAPVTQGFSHIRKRGGAPDDLPGGISRECMADGSIRYFVVSIQSGSKTTRRRFSAKRLGTGCALFRALSLRADHLGVSWHSLLAFLDPRSRAIVLMYALPSPEQHGALSTTPS